MTVVSFWVVSCVTHTRNYVIINRLFTCFTREWHGLRNDRIASFSLPQAGPYAPSWSRRKIDEDLWTVDSEMTLASHLVAGTRRNGRTWSILAASLPFTALYLLVGDYWFESTPRPLLYHVPRSPWPLPALPAQSPIVVRALDSCYGDFTGPLRRLLQRCVASPVLPLLSSRPPDACT